MSEDGEKEGLAAPFKGITTNGQVMPGLFEISPSGVSTEPVRNAAEKFIATLSNVQLARTMFPVDDPEWRKWMNQHFYIRQGVSFREMNEAQRDAASAYCARPQRQGIEADARHHAAERDAGRDERNDHELLANGSTTSP